VGRVNPKYVSEELDIRRQYVNDALGDLVTAGWLRKPVTGLYEFVDDPRED
jgi:predicted transcriptional regulator